MFAYTTMWVASIRMWAHQIEMRAHARYKNLQLNCHFVIDGSFHGSEPYNLTVVYTRNFKRCPRDIYKVLCFVNKTFQPQ